MGGCGPEFGQLLEALVQSGGVQQTGLHGAVGSQRQVPADALQELGTQRGWGGMGWGWHEKCRQVGG